MFEFTPDLRWGLFGRFLDFLRLMCVMGLTLILAPSPFMFLELSRFECNTNLASTNSVHFKDIDWDYGVVSTIAAAFIMLLCIHALPTFPETPLDIAATAVTAAVPVVWAPYVVGVIATPECPDSALISNDGAPPFALVAKNATVMDDGVAAMSMGLLLSGFGSAALLMVLAAGTALDPTGKEHDRRMSGIDYRVHGGVVAVALLFYMGGAIAVYDSDNFSSDQWSKTPARNAYVKATCSDGDTAVFDTTFGAESRDALSDLNISAFSLALLSLIALAVCALGAFFQAKTMGTLPKAVYLVMGFMFTLVHILITFLLSQVTYVGSNPACVEATLAGDDDGSRGFTVMAYGWVAIVMYALVVSPYYAWEDTTPTYAQRDAEAGASSQEWTDVKATTTDDKAAQSTNKGGATTDATGTKTTGADTTVPAQPANGHHTNGDHPSEPVSTNVNSDGVVVHSMYADAAAVEETEGAKPEEDSWDDEEGQAVVAPV